MSTEAQQAGVGGGPPGNRVHLETPSFFPVGSLALFSVLGDLGLSFKAVKKKKKAVAVKSTSFVQSCGL